MTKVAKYGYLLEDSNVKSWHDNLYVRSPITAEVYLRTMGLYCELNSTSPSKIIEESTRTTAESMSMSSKFKIRNPTTS